MATSSNSKRIAVFSLAYHPAEGGAEIACREIMERLPHLRFSIFMHRFDPAWPRREDAGGVEVTRVGHGGSGRIAKLAYVFRAWRAAEAAHRREPFAATWAIMAAYGGAAALLFKLRHPRVPLLLTLQEGDDPAHIRARVGLWRPLWRLLFRRANHVQAISSYLAEFARENGARCPITIVPNGVDFKMFSHSESSRQAPKNHFVISGQARTVLFEPFDFAQGKLESRSAETKTIITTSRLVRKNGVDVLIRAFSQLPNYPITQLLIVGDGPERASLEQLARGLGITDRVIFAGQVPYEDIPRWLARADIFVRPSRSEGLGSSFLEAMAAGLPIIGTPVGGIPDFLKDGETGLFAAVDDPADLAEKMGALLTDAVLRQRLAAAGEKLARERYTWDRVAGEMREIFDGLRPPARILIATGLFPPDVGGPATYSKLLADELPKRGFATDVASFGAVRRLPPLVRHAAYLLTLIRAGRRADVIFAQDPVSVGLPAAIAARILRKPFLLKVVGDYAWEQGQQRFGVSELLDDFLEKRYGARVEALRAVERSVARRAARLIVPSEYLARVVRAWGVPAKRITVIPNAVELPPRTPRHEARARLGLRGTAVFSAGRLVPWKGFHLLIAAVAAMRPRFPDLSLTIAGEGPERENLKSQISNLKSDGYIRLVGALPKSELAMHLAAADIFALHTGYEGFSHQLIEAMAVGLPIVTTPAGGNSEIVRDEENGILTPYGDERALVGALERLIREPKLRASLGARAARDAAQFTTDAMFEKLSEVIANEVLDKLEQ